MKTIVLSTAIFTCLVLFLSRSDVFKSNILSLFTMRVEDYGEWPDTYIQTFYAS